MTSIVFPGQGSQFVGMSKDFYDNFSASKLVIDEIEDITSISIKNIMFEDYQKQIDQLEGVDEELRKKLVKFRDDEVEHKNTAIDEGSREAFGYSVLRKTINETTKAAIFLAERI